MSNTFPVGDPGADDPPRLRITPPEGQQLQLKAEGRTSPISAVGSEIPKLDEIELSPQALQAAETQDDFPKADTSPQPEEGRLAGIDLIV
ncbi:hypothetical protein [Sulfidibacter corallicola]|uniref:Uncharacterized protein n=1 Tax=Sulfidibacter corallicola TaxID=2818388 RepID=A0A8A4TXK0_SULCO|nr:hypothetical protein [Sulfidibacter corallicola]QTD54220.1 hypothetical protein J3U87_17380 [Sulfidibacter corallicola]